MPASPARVFTNKQTNLIEQALMAATKKEQNINLDDEIPTQVCSSSCKNFNNFLQLKYFRRPKIFWARRRRPNYKFFFHVFFLTLQNPHTISLTSPNIRHIKSISARKTQISHYRYHSDPP